MNHFIKLYCSLYFGDLFQLHMTTPFARLLVQAPRGQKPRAAPGSRNPLSGRVPSRPVLSSRLLSWRIEKIENLVGDALWI